MNSRLCMLKTILAYLLLFINYAAFTQQPAGRSIRIIIVDAQKKLLPGSSVYLLNQDSAVIRSGVITDLGSLEWLHLGAGIYRVRATATGYEAGLSSWIDLFANNAVSDTIILKAKTQVLENVLVVSKKPAIQFLPDKTVVNPEASITNAGATAMDVLEKSPGITVSKDGSLIMKGK